MPASDVHPEYDNHVAQVKVVRDNVAGQDAIKRGKTAYLPMPDAADTSQENTTRYKQYLKRATFVPFTAMTLEGLMGMVFRKQAEIDLNTSIEYLNKNTTGSGLTLEQFTREVVSEVSQAGRYGLLVDYPNTDRRPTKAEVKALNLRANIVGYRTESIINWQTTTIGGVTILSLIALKEAVKEYSDDGFKYEEKEYTRVLRLEEGIYKQELYNDTDDLVEQFYPEDSKGQKWNRIPFQFVGTKNNDEMIDKSLLIDIAHVNIAHYNYNADFAESSHIVGQPTLSISGLNQTWVDEILKGGVRMGSATALLLPENSSSSLLQASQNTMPESGMKICEQQMVMLGARLIMDSGGVETAEAARIRYAGQNSKLSVAVSNVESAFMQCFEWGMMFMGGDGDNKYKLNRDYYDKTMDAQTIMAQIQLLDRGAIAMPDLRGNLRSHGVVENDRTDEDIDSDAEILEI